MSVCLAGLVGSGTDFDGMGCDGYFDPQFKKLQWDRIKVLASGTGKSGEFQKKGQTTIFDI